MMKGFMETEGLQLVIIIVIVSIFSLYLIYQFLMSNVVITTSEASSFAASYLGMLIREGGGILNVSSIDPIEHGMLNCKYEVVLRGLTSTYERPGDMKRVKTVDFSYLPVYANGELKMRKVVADVYEFPKYFCQIYYVWETGNPLRDEWCKDCTIRVGRKGRLVCIDDGRLYCKALGVPVGEYEGSGMVVLEKRGGKVVVRPE